MADILIRGVRDDVLALLKRRAENNRRSLQQELLVILEDAVRLPERRAAIDAADAIRECLASSGRSFSDSALDLRGDRRG